MHIHHRAQYPNYWSFPPDYYYNTTTTTSPSYPASPSCSMCGKGYYQSSPAVIVPTTDAKRCPGPSSHEAKTTDSHANTIFADSIKKKTMKKKLGEMQITMYHSPYCGHCKKMSELLKEYSSVIDMRDVSTPEVQAYIKENMGDKIRGVPYFVSAMHGTDHAGSTPTIEALIDKLTPSSSNK